MIWEKIHDIASHCPRPSSRLRQHTEKKTGRKLTISYNNLWDPESMTCIPSTPLDTSGSGRQTTDIRPNTTPRICYWPLVGNNDTPFGKLSPRRPSRVAWLPRSPHETACPGPGPLVFVLPRGRASGNSTWRHCGGIVQIVGVEVHRSQRPNWFSNSHLQW